MILLPSKPVAVMQESLDVPLYRAKHDHERGPLWRWRVPEVYPLFDKTTPLGENEQKMWFGLFRHGAPSLLEPLAKSRWTDLLGNWKAFTNGTGFGDKSDLRANHITKENLQYPVPDMDKSRYCGGATFTGREEGNELVISTLTEAVDLDWLLQRPWYYFHATIVYKERIGMFPHGHQAELGIYEPTLVPLISRWEMRVSLDDVQRVNDIADPYYLPLMTVIRSWMRTGIKLLRQ